MIPRTKPLVIADWRTPVSHYPARKLGRAEIKRTVDKARGSLYYAEGVEGHLFVEYKKNPTVISLEIEGRVWMTDQFAYTRSLHSFAERSRGRVLVAGLGLGIVVHQLLANPAVILIDVVERELDVARLVRPLLPRDARVHILHEDFYQYVGRTQNLTQYDNVIWDLGLWGGGMEREEGRDTAHVIKPLMMAKYGVPMSSTFVHGLDRDPVGEEFVRKNTALVRETLESLGLTRRSHA